VGTLIIPIGVGTIKKRKINSKGKSVEVEKKGFSSN
jgi:hypothetical protein